MQRDGFVVVGMGMELEEVGMVEGLEPSDDYD